MRRRSGGPTGSAFTSVTATSLHRRAGSLPPRVARRRSAALRPQLHSIHRSRRRGSSDGGWGQGTHRYLGPETTIEHIVAEFAERYPSAESRRKMHRWLLDLFALTAHSDPADI